MSFSECIQWLRNLFTHRTQQAPLSPTTLAANDPVIPQDSSANKTT